MKKNLVIFSLLVLLLQACGQIVPIAQMPEGNYKLDKNHASVTWKVSHMGLSYYTARFTKIDAALDFDPKNPTKSKLTAIIDPFSVKTDYPDADKKDFDRELGEGKDWFNGKKFPQIKFESNDIEITGKNTGKVHGNLTFLGVTKPVILDVTLNGNYSKMPFLGVPAVGFSATTTLHRSDFGMDKYSKFIGDEIQVLIEVEFHKQK